MDERHPADYELARSRVIGRLVLRVTFIFDLSFFLLVLALLWLNVPQTPDERIAALFTLVMWGGALLVHGALAFNLFGSLIDRLTRRELERAALAEKPKRKRLEVSDDGELVEVEWAQDDLEQGQHHA